MNNKRIALYGGSFSPPHLGHASVIEAISRLFPCDEIWVMPSADRHDKKVTASGKHRIKMLELMINEIFPSPTTSIVVSDLELNMNKPTVTYETMLALKEKYPGYQFHFVLGSENFDVIETKWVKGKKLFREASFIVIKNSLMPLPKKLPPHITIIDDIPWTNISSTFIRKLIVQGHSGLPYLSKKVAEYIRVHQLYK